MKAQDPKQLRGVGVAFLGAGVAFFVGALAAGQAAFTGVGAAFIVRGGALRFGWRFPVYRPRPGRHPDDVM